MKFTVGGQKEDSWFHSKKNRIIIGIVASVQSTFVIPAILSTGETFDWRMFFWTFIFFGVIELIFTFIGKKEDTDGMMSLELLDDDIIIKFISGEVEEIPHNQIQSIRRDLTKVIIDVKGNNYVYNIHYYNFTYNDVQKIKKEVDKISQKISTLPKENPAFS